jgi:hypothetical protein
MRDIRYKAKIINNKAKPKIGSGKNNNSIIMQISKMRLVIGFNL